MRFIRMIKGRGTPEPTDIELHTCHICEKAKPANEGGMSSTGDINNPVMRWICNVCLIGKVCP